MRLKNSFLVTFLMIYSLIGTSQISPGDLTYAHAEYEGISNCTLCHDLGKNVSNAKCLDCHKDIQSLISLKRGYHFSKEVKDKDCFDCHSEHHGRKFEISRFDEEKFKHDLTGYILKQKHGRIECRDCHKPDNIKDSDIRNRKDTYLGLNLACLTCHDDFHQETLSKDCAKCHDEEKFKPAPKFKHDDTKYKLVGKHIDVKCVKCHKIEKKNGKDFQYFTNLDFDDCKSCHEDPHLKQLPGDCSKCHIEKDFKIFKGKNRFNHNKTKFVLKGKHRKINCFECHIKTKNPKLTFQDRIGVKVNDCKTCHDDVHKGKFGLDCAKCHNEKSFLVLNNMDFFDHAVTDYPLTGKHINLDCKECHEGRFTEVINFSNCNNCHEDYHNGEFIKNNVSPDCIDCHSLEKGFDYSLFDLERHQLTEFPLKGAHIATPCFECHLSEDRWNFKKIGENCVDCHEDIHEKFIDQKYYPERDCQKCHNEESWAKMDFDHKETDWTLEGKHLEIECKSCHFIKDTVKNVIIQQFKPLLHDCFNCHDNIHDNQFVIEGVTDCNRCHDPKDWIPRNFDHNLTKFPLDGKHADLECHACHKPKEGNNSKKINYKIEKFECIDCHG